MESEGYGMVRVIVLGLPYGDGHEKAWDKSQILRRGLEGDLRVKVTAMKVWLILEAETTIYVLLFEKEVDPFLAKIAELSLMSQGAEQGVVVRLDFVQAGKGLPLPEKDEFVTIGTEEFRNKFIEETKRRRET